MKHLKGKFLQKLSFLFFCVLWFSPIFQSSLFPGDLEPVELEDHTISNLSENISYCIDESNNMTRDKFSECNFQKNTHGRINFGISHPSLLFKFRLSFKKSQKNPSDYILYVDYTQLDSVQIYLPQKSGGYLTKQGGDLFPFHQRDHSSRSINFLLNQDFDETRDVYLKISTDSAMIVPIYVSSLQEFEKHNQIVYLLSGAYFGILAVMILYNFFIFWNNKEVLYIYYILFTFFSLCYMFAFMGFGFEFIWSDFPILQQKMILGSAILMLVFLIVFSIKYLNLERQMSRLSIYIEYSILYPILLFIASIFLNNSTINILLTPYGVLIIVLFPLIGIQLLKRGNRTAKFFIIAWLPYIIANAILIFKLFGVLTRLNLESIFFIQISNIAEVIFFSVALSDRINQKKNHFQKNLEKLNFELEHKVAERTRELNENVKLLKRDMTFAKNIQMKLLPEESKEISGLLFISKYLPMEEVGGDYFDIIRISPGRIRVLIADATGHGVQGALITLLIKSEFDLIKYSERNPSHVVGLLNKSFYEKYYFLNSYFTCFLIDIHTDKKEIRYCSAGHPDQLLLSANNLTPLSKTGKMAGVMNKVKFLEIRKPFFPGDKLFLYTDGLFEEFNKFEKEFGEENVYQVFSTFHKDSISSIVGKIFAKLDEFLGDSQKQDDITIVGIEWNSGKDSS
ncbi:MAG: SpoIIE family protein phosphatase [Leptospiraceae bacterium]|nr:SpoIIE family protein phosphatase [Leptospiraceae bacterium]MCP5510419.1 SpoIIE family protein phosphatase [Leptospiraceae bacterium]